SGCPRFRFVKPGSSDVCLFSYEQSEPIRVLATVQPRHHSRCDPSHLADVNASSLAASCSRRFPKMSEQLVALSNALAEATDRAAASAVAVHTEARGSSSGIVWRAGVIVTADHALNRDEDIQVTLPDGRVVAASLAGRDVSTDLAVLKCA